VTGERDTVHFQLSPLTMVGIVAAVISTIAVIIAAITASHTGGPPPGPGAPPPPPPPSSTPLLLAVAFFVTSWVTVAVAIARDQIVQRVGLLNQALEEVRTQVAEVAKLEGRITAVVEEYGEQRETDGYIAAMHAAEKGDVRPLGTIRPRNR
jgi:hypothetical protein